MTIVDLFLPHIPSLRTHQPGRYGSLSHPQVGLSLSGASPVCGGALHCLGTSVSQLTDVSLPQGQSYSIEDVQLESVEREHTGVAPARPRPTCDSDVLRPGSAEI